MGIVKRYRETLLRFVRYGVIGATGIGVNFLVLRAVWPWLSSRPEFASAFAIEISILSNYVLNSRFTFKTPLTWGSLWRYNLAMAGGGVLQTAIFTELVHLHLYYLWANLVAIPFATLLGFFISQRWVFRVPKGGQPDAPPNVPETSSAVEGGAPAPAPGPRPRR